MSPSTHLHREIRTQPSDWVAVAGRVAELTDRLPAAGERVLAAGCGTSYYMAQAYAGLRTASGQGLTHAAAASEVTDELVASVDVLLVITRSGTTTEVLDLLRRVGGRDGLRTVAVVATEGTPVLDLSDAAITLPEVDEESVVQTRFATTVLALLRSSLGEDLSEVARQAQQVLDTPVEELLGEMQDVDQVTFLGAGWSYGIAQEAGLKLRETSQFWTEGYHAMEYRHGPISIAQPGRVVWVFGTAPDGLEQDVARTGAHFTQADRDPLADLVRVHLLCEHVAARRGLDPDTPRHLTRSIVLDEPAASGG